MNLEFTFRRACIADTDLGRVRTDLIVERQVCDGGNDAGTCRQVGTAQGPAGVHDIDGQRVIRAGRFQQQPNPIAAQFQIVTVAVHRRRGGAVGIA